MAWSPYCPRSTGITEAFGSPQKKLRIWIVAASACGLVSLLINDACRQSFRRSIRTSIRGMSTVPGITEAFGSPQKNSRIWISLPLAAWSVRPPRQLHAGVVIAASGRRDSCTRAVLQGTTSYGTTVVLLQQCRTV